MSNLYALDFDGVLCDSCGESSLSALKAAKLRWPAIFKNITEEIHDHILNDMRTVRPVVETGYENLLLVRLLMEIYDPSIRVTAVAEGLTVAGILRSWETLKLRLMEGWGERDRDDLVACFGDFRDQWIATDLEGWIGANRFYPGTADALRFSTSTIYIVTTKQTRFALALLKELAGVDFPEERIFGLGTGPKVEVLKQLQSRPEHRGMQLHFVEDRFATLKNVIKDRDLDGWNLYLGTWGYNTESEREEAAKVSRISLVNLEHFCKKLK